MVDRDDVILATLSDLAIFGPLSAEWHWCLRGSVGQREKIGVVGGTSTESPFLRINNRLDMVFTAEMRSTPTGRIAIVVDPTLDRVAY